MVTKITIILTLFIFITSQCFSYKKGYSINTIYGNIQARVNNIIDGDTFTATIFAPDNIEIDVKVRMLGIDTPEISGQCEYERKMAQKAKLRLSELIPENSIVNLQFTKDDKYLGRIDAKVFKNNIDIGHVLISEKLARPYEGKKRLPWCDMF